MSRRLGNIHLRVCFHPIGGRYARYARYATIDNRPPLLGGLVEPGYEVRTLGSEILRDRPSRGREAIPHCAVALTNRLLPSSK